MTAEVAALQIKTLVTADDLLAMGDIGPEVGIYTRRNPDTVRAADGAFISDERYAQPKQTHGFLDVAPDLIVEILSPDDRWSEIKQKLREYFSWPASSKSNLPVLLR